MPTTVAFPFDAFQYANARSAVPVQTSRIGASPDGGTSSTVFRRHERSMPSDSSRFKKSYRPAIWPNISWIRAADLSSVMVGHGPAAAF